MQPSYGSATGKTDGLINTATKKQGKPCHPLDIDSNIGTGHKRGSCFGSMTGLVTRATARRTP